MNVSSALAYVPASFAPVYSASMVGTPFVNAFLITPKRMRLQAFNKSFTLSLREQLRPTNVKVIEIAPPLVQSNLHQHKDVKYEDFV